MHDGAVAGPPPGWRDRTNESDALNVDDVSRAAELLQCLNCEMMHKADGHARALLCFGRRSELLHARCAACDRALQTAVSSFCKCT